MTVIKARVRVGDDGMVHLQLPKEVSGDEVDVVVTSHDSEQKARDTRREAARAGGLRDVDISVAEFLRTREEDEELREHRRQR